MKDFISLKILDKFAFLIRFMGVDYKTLRRILSVKLTLDNRRASLFNKNRYEKDEEIDSNVFKMYWFYGFIGLFLYSLSFIGDSPFIGLTLFFAIIIFMIMSSLITDFTSIMLDTKDKLIILTKPVPKKTLTIARTIHILIYLLSLLLFLATPGIVGFSVRYGVFFGLLLIISLVFISFLSILFTSLVYYILLNLFDGEKLKDIINALQIFFVVVISVGYQLVIRLFDVVGVNVVFNAKWWSVFIVPSWFAAPFEIIFTKNNGFIFILLSVIALVSSIFSLFIHIKIISPNFEKYLYKLENSGEDNKKEFKIKLKINEFICNLLTKDSLEKGFIKFVQVMLKKDRSLKMRLFPSLAFSVFLPLILIFFSSLRGAGFKNVLENMSLSQNIKVFYFGIFLMGSIMSTLSYSDSYKGAWIFKTLPIKGKDFAIKGMFKAVYISYFIPIFTLFFILFISIFKVSSLDDLLFMFLALFTESLLLIRWNKKKYPFSEKHSKTSEIEENFKNIFGGGLIIGIYVLSSSFLFKNLYTEIGVFFISILFNVFLWKTSFREGKVDREEVKAKVDLI
ncbi:hypothetical protein [Helicovermis profundi]|uniref:ABC transporter permease n=1 Tax=Helicovermis profundi TaxID=3065157 RepID=A0AAU9E985_9FIRM|nr:hypothetical protein HLPR_01300 [Clostridia bacterium S502]